MIHGNMPRKVVEQKGLDTKLCDLLDELFPIQVNLYYNYGYYRKKWWNHCR